MSDTYAVGDRVYLRNQAGGVMHNARGKPDTFHIVRTLEIGSTTNYVLTTYDRDANRMYGGGIGFPANCLTPAA
jgi:hypothetical protein